MVRGARRIIFVGGGNIVARTSKHCLRQRYVCRRFPSQLVAQTLTSERLRKDAPEGAAREDAREDHCEKAARDARWRAVRRAFVSLQP